MGDYAAGQSFENVGTLYAFPTYETARIEENIRCPSKCVCHSTQCQISSHLKRLSSISIIEMEPLCEILLNSGA